MIMNKLSAVLIGAGDRGARAYAPFALANPHELDIVAVADPNPDRRHKVMKEHQISEDHGFESWDALLNGPPRADIAIICTMDRMHLGPTIAALKAGYHVLLEKPMSPDPLECIEMERTAREHNRLLTICHVLRYTEFWSNMKRIIEEGHIGEVVSVQLNENVEVMHMSHSFVRGNWKSKEQSSPMILQKSCHDMDILSWIIDKPCLRVSSYGSLMHFKESNAPLGAPERCLDGCPAENDCPFHAGRYYLGEGKGWARKFTEDHTNDGIIYALKTTDYGKCVYRSDNNVVDHQVVNMEFEGGATATFSMCGFTREQTRIVQIMGTKGEIRGNMDNNSISLFNFLTKHESTLRLSEPVGGHGGGDARIVKSFLNEVRRYGEGVASLSSASVSLRSHLMAFAAEESRMHKGKSIELDEYYHEIQNDV